MALTRVDTGLQSFPDFNRNQQLANAQIYIGVPGLDPAILANQYQAYVVQEDGTQVAVPQPIRTSAGGVPTYNGSPVQIGVAEAQYSLKILSSTGSQIYYQPDNTDLAIVNAAQVTYNPAGTGAVATTVENFLRQIVSVKDFGAAGDGVTDDTAAIQAALIYVNALSSATSKPGGAPLLVSSFPAIRLQFPAGKYLVSSQLVSVSARIRIEGDNALVFANNGVIPASYLFLFTGGYDVTIDGLNICSTETGCIEVNAPNISSATFNISNCNFIGNNLSYGTAIKYTNQSSILKVEKCLFQNVKHAYEYVNCDWQEFSNCWFDFALLATNPLVYADGEGYFKNCRARFIVQESLFAGGPGVSGTETAYFEVRGRCDLTLRKLRISQETGGGVIVNWNFPINLTNGSGFLRQGITMEDIECSPRDDNYNFPNGTVSTPLIRLFQMPNYISLRNINMRNTPNGFIAPAASTTLETLYQAAKAQSYLYTQTYYELKDVVGNQMYLAATTDALVHKKWLELFNCFNYLFDPDSINNAATHKVRTFFTGNQLNSLSLDVRLSVAHGLGQRYQYRQIVSVVRTASAGNHEFRVRDVSAIGVIGSNSVTIDPVFRNINTGVEAATIPVGSTLTDFIVVLNINLVGGSTSNFKVIDCWAIPEYDNHAKTETNGTPRQFLTKALP